MVFTQPMSGVSLPGHRTETGPRQIYITSIWSQRTPKLSGHSKAGPQLWNMHIDKKRIYVERAQRGTRQMIVVRYNIPNCQDYIMTNVWWWTVVT